MTSGASLAIRKLSKSFGAPIRALSEVMAASRPAFADCAHNSALDALSHSLESIWNVNSNPVSDTLAVEAAQRDRHVAGPPRDARR
jgi:hypothetical protein